MIALCAGYDHAPTPQPPRGFGGIAHELVAAVAVFGLLPAWVCYHREIIAFLTSLIPEF